MGEATSSEASWKRPAPEVRTPASTPAVHLDANARNIHHAASVLEVAARDFHEIEGQVSADLAAPQRTPAGQH